MAQKYTILKAITRTSNKGFTLLELLVGMIITLIVGGLAMQAFINASATFSKDKKSIDSTQNSSAVLDIIGNDIKQAGENIGDPKFPAIEFGVDSASTANPKSSKITIRRALSDPLTLCEDLLPANLTTTTQILVADTTKGNANCNVTQLIAARTTTALSSVPFILPATATNVLPSPALNLLLPNALRNARDYRCKLPDPNRDYTIATTDFCDSLTGRNLVKVAVSDGLGHMFVFNQTGEIVDTSNAVDTVNPNTYTLGSVTPSIFKKYRITVDTTDTTPDPDSMLANNTNNIVSYIVGNPIYLIEERVYTLNNSGNLQVSVDGKPPSTLIKRLSKFTVSARRYSDVVTKTLNSSPSNSCDSTTNTQFATNFAYTCKFEAIPIPTAPDTYNWKTLAGVKIELQAKYDGTGQNATATPADEAKLSATAEFFPRNVLSK